MFSSGHLSFFQGSHSDVQCETLKDSLLYYVKDVFQKTQEHHSLDMIFRLQNNCQQFKKSVIDSEGRILSYKHQQIIL